jgi:predicted DNA-binding protein (MmcQ/YjbR family)/predicted GNAT family N-acyltransferase
MSKKRSVESFPFDEYTMVIKVENKIFALLSIDKPGFINLKHHSLLIPELLEQYQAIQPGYHMNKNHWITVCYNDGSLSASFIQSLIDISYSLIVQSLPKRIRLRLHAICKIIAYQSEEYKSSLALRNEVLRQPLGLHFTDQDIAEDLHDIHIIASTEDHVIGCLILKEIDKTIVKMRQVAISPTFQGMGIGKEMVEFAEQIAIQMHYSTMELHARIESASFYDSLLYTRIGNEFKEVNIPHIKMFKHL